MYTAIKAAFVRVGGCILLYFLTISGSEPHTSVCHGPQAIYCHGLQRYHDGTSSQLTWA